MATVSEIVRDIAAATGERHETVNAYARALIDGGLLPKSRGRAIAHVTARHMVRLILAIGIEPKIREAAADVRKWGALRPCAPQGRPKGAPPYTRQSAEDRLTELAEVVLPGFPRPKSDDKEAQDRFRMAFGAKITIVRNAPEIIIAYPEASAAERFLRPGTEPVLSSDKLQRSTTVGASIFFRLGREKDWDLFAEDLRTEVGD